MILLTDLAGTPHYVAAAQVERISGVPNGSQASSEDQSRVFLRGGSILRCKESPEQIYSLVTKELTA